MHCSIICYAIHKQNEPVWAIEMAWQSGESILHMMFYEQWTLITSEIMAKPLHSNWWTLFTLVSSLSLTKSLTHKHTLPGYNMLQTLSCILHFNAILTKMSHHLLNHNDDTTTQLHFISVQNIFRYSDNNRVLFNLK
jgi:hypothetical protein